MTENCSETKTILNYCINQELEEVVSLEMLAGSINHFSSLCHRTTTEYFNETPWSFKRAYQLHAFIFLTMQKSVFSIVPSSLRAAAVNIFIVGK